MINKFTNNSKSIKICLLTFIAIMFHLHSYAQNTNSTNDILDSNISLENNQDGTRLESGTLPSGFNGINLGMDSKSVIELLKKDFLFAYVDQVFRTSSPYDKQIFSVEGRNFIDHAYFYFSQEDKLISMSLFLNEKYIDYGIMFEKLRSKYGRPKMDPSKALWSETDISIRLEKPLSIKYILEHEISTKNNTSTRSEIDIDKEQFLEYF